MKSKKVIFTTILSVLVCFAFSPQTRAACGSPDPGCPTGNLGEGFHALLSLTSGTYNTGIGASSLPSLTEGNYNTGVGASTLLATTGSENTAAGAAALASNTSGLGNTAVGAFALYQSNVTGLGIGLNTAVGNRALFSATTAPWNVGVGYSAIHDNITGFGNVGVGYNSLEHTTGDANTALGHAAGSNATTGDGNVYIGAGMNGVVGENNHTYIRNVKDTIISSGNFQYVTVNLDSGLVGHQSSSRRYKKDIKPMDKVSEALYQLKPVTYRYKKEIDRTQSPAFGLIAEEVAEVNPDLVARNAKGQPESVHYEMVNAMLLNEFLKEHKKVQALEATVAQQQKGMEVLTAQLKAQGAQIQKVSAQIEVSKPATKVVANK
jgi:Chaperone of endosialidase